MCPAHGARCGRGLSPHSPPNHDRSKLCCLQSCSAEVKNRIFACHIREQIIINSLGGGGVRGGLHPPLAQAADHTQYPKTYFLRKINKSLLSSLSRTKSKKSPKQEAQRRPGRMLMFISMS